MRLIAFIVFILAASAAFAGALTDRAKSYVVAGKTCDFFLERASDGGMVINTVCEDEADSVVNYRAWYSDPAQARADFALIDDARYVSTPKSGEYVAPSRADRVTKAVEQGISGSRQFDADEVFKQALALDGIAGLEARIAAEEARIAAEALPVEALP